MPQNRRTAIRRQATLPFQWCPVAAGATQAEICRALGLPGAMALQSRLAELDDDLRRVHATLTDTRIADAIRVLDRKLSVLEEAVLSQAPLPPTRPLAVSADGLGFDADEALDPGSTLGVHLVLPPSYHVVGGARVSRCTALDDGRFRIGAEFHHLEAPAARRLTRYAIGREREEG